MFRRISSVLLVAAASTLLAVSGDAGDPARPAPLQKQGKGPKGGKTTKPAPPEKPVNEVVQEFPTNGEMETAWKVQWATVRGYGLYLTGAWYKKSPTDRWMQVLGDARISEIFVPYHRGSPRFWDVSYNFDLCVLGKDDAGPFGKLLRTRPGDAPRVVQEIRDRGIIYKDYKVTRRGQTLLLWGCLEAANYRYITEYGFQDDGAVTFRLGSTGRNYGGAEYEPHMHNGLWRIDVNLDGPENNSVYVVEHIEPLPEKIKAKSTVTPFNGGKEGWADWNAEKFTMLRVINEKIKNSRGDHLAYDLMPMRMGNARHFGNNREACTQHDFWVTKARPNEVIYTNLPKFVEDGEPIMNADVVLWHSAAMHHEPRLEDGKMVNGGLQGVTHTMWAGFLLRPRNLFEHTPLYPYNKTR
jgi:primary-amine oxidase